MKRYMFEHPILLTESVFLKIKTNFFKCWYSDYEKGADFKQCLLYITNHALLIVEIRTNRFLIISHDDIKSRGRIYSSAIGFTIFLDGCLYEFEFKPIYYWDKLLQYVIYEYDIAKSEVYIKSDLDKLGRV
ncbi:hypothetical protein D3C76_1050070 [compost metagenome]